MSLTLEGTQRDLPRSANDRKAGEGALAGISSTALATVFIHAIDAWVLQVEGTSSFDLLTDAQQPDGIVASVHPAGYKERVLELFGEALLTN